VRNVVKIALTNAGYEVLAAVDGAHALELSRSFDAPIHLLLTDVCMPNLSGPELAKTLSLERPGIRIVLMTGTSGAVIDPSGPKLLHKPFRPGHLVEQIAAELKK
jgi:two-component system, cell cycle sensor histidine kinase and response regulator CckA